MIKNKVIKELFMKATPVWANQTAVQRNYVEERNYIYFNVDFVYNLRS